MLHSIYCPIFLFFLLIFISPASNAQNRVFQGRVICFNEIPVNGVSIKSSKAKDETTSDSLGYFSIMVRQKSDRIKLRANGFSTMSYKIDVGRDSVTLNMVYNRSKKNDKLVTAYGHIKEKDLTYALSNLQNANNQFSNYTNIFDILATLPSVRVEQGSYPPNIHIRGSNSLMSSTNPLFILDGMPTDISFVADINPVEIKEISVIKDAGASIYGSRGSNGVILIVLK